MYETHFISVLYKPGIYVKLLFQSWDIPLYLNLKQEISVRYIRQWKIFISVRVFTYSDVIQIILYHYNETDDNTLLSLCNFEMDIVPIQECHIFNNLVII